MKRHPLPAALMLIASGLLGFFGSSYSRRHFDPATAHSTCTHVEVGDDSNDTELDLFAVCTEGQTIQFRFHTEYAVPPLCALKASTYAFINESRESVTITVGATPAPFSHAYKVRCVQ